MDLNARLSALKGQRGAPAAEPAILGTTISERVRRLTVQATPTKRVCTDDQEVAARLQGQACAPGLIRIEQRRLLAQVPGWERVSPAAFSRFSLLAGGEAIEPNELLFLDTETTGLAGGTGTLPF